MKKILSVLLALTMIAVLGLTAFAADIVGPTDPIADQTGDTIVKTVIDPDAANPETYTVAIPADIDITWGDTEVKSLNYAVTSQLKLGATLTVSAKAADAKLMNGTNGLAYEANGLELDCIFNEINDGAAPETAIDIKVPSFADVPIAEYSTTITYTVAYTAAP